MIALKMARPRYLLAAISLFFFLILSFSLWDVSNLHTTLQKHLGNGITFDQHAYIVNATAHELDALYNPAFNISDFATMGERFSRFSTLAESTLAQQTLDTEPLLSLLRKYYPWWQPLPTTYVPWQQSLKRGSKKDHKGATGIVICAGSSNLIYAIHLVLSLRNILKSQLPIQIAYAGDNDLSFADRVNITNLGPDIEALNLLDYFDEEIAGLQNGGWAMKPFAMLASRFQKTIVLDADAMFVRSPDDLFDTEPGLIQTGTLFWHDRAFNPDSEEPLSWVKSLMGSRQPSTLFNQSLLWQKGIFHEMDSAAVCMDKGRPGVFMSLLFATWMNLREIRDEVTYRHVHGDKETFWLACELSYCPYYYNPVYAGIIGTPKVVEPEENPPPQDTTKFGVGDQSNENIVEVSPEETKPEDQSNEIKQHESTGEDKSSNPPEETKSEESHDDTKTQDSSSENKPKDPPKDPKPQDTPSESKLKEPEKDAKPKVPPKDTTPAEQPKEPAPQAPPPDSKFPAPDDSTSELRSPSDSTKELHTRASPNPENRTLDLREICSAQALHLDHRRRPLWFNGSLRKDKSLINNSLEKLKDLLSGKLPEDSSPSANSEEHAAKIKEQIQSVAQDIALGTFTHWMPGATNWTDATPDYRVGTVQSCLLAKEDAKDLDTSMKETLERIVKGAREADQKYYGFGRAGFLLKAEQT